MISYLIEFSLLFAFFGIINLLLIRHSGRFDFRRKYLIISTLISILVPLIPSLPAKSVTVFSKLLPAVEVIAHGMQTVQSTVAVEQVISLLTITLILYGTITFFFLIKFLRAAYLIRSIFKNNKVSSINQTRVVYAETIKNPCSFFKTILLPSQRIFSDDELQAIIKHENTHIELDHTIEKVFFEILKIVFWWHPVSWLYNNELELIHELQVDEQMEQKMNPSLYKEILVQLIIYPPHLRLAHSFSSNIKKRIQTMNQKKNKFSPVQLFSLCALLFMATVFIHSCAEANEDQYKSKIDEVNVIAASSDVNSYELAVVDTITTFDFDTYQETVEIVESTEKIYRTPENMPLFPGCDDIIGAEELKSCSNQNLLKFIYSNLVYPADARTKGIEGMVLIKFVVNDKGTIERRAFVKTLGNGIEESVDAMLDKMQNEIKWIPGNVGGKNVNVEYTLPVKFKLEG